MKKIFLNLICIFTILSSFFIDAYAFNTTVDNVRVTTENTWRQNNNSTLEDIWANWDFFYVWTWWEKWLKWFILNIARDLRVMAFVFVLFLVIIMVIKLLFAENTEEQQKKLKMWILWATVWIMVMQVSFSVYKVVFDRDVWASLARSFWDKVIQPFTDLLLFLAAFVFIVMAIISFYNLVTAWWNEEWIKKWRKNIFNAIIWFVIIKFSAIIVKNTFNPDCWWWSVIAFWWSKVCENVKDNTKIIFTLINWFNTFLSIIIVLMLIYWGFLIMTSGWDEEKSKKAKNIFLYSFIGLLILFASYLILTFFIIPESKIW